MEPTIVIAIVAGAVAIGGSILTFGASLIASWFFTRGDRDRIATLEARTDNLWAAREADALVKRAQGDHIDALEDWIRAGKPPPPPPRPPGV